MLAKQCDGLIDADDICSCDGLEILQVAFVSAFVKGGHSLTSDGDLVSVLESVDAGQAAADVRIQARNDKAVNSEVLERSVKLGVEEAQLFTAR